MNQVFDIEGDGKMSVERQVKILVGIFVILGIALGWSVSPWFYWLAIFAGVGQIFAGMTGFCSFVYLFKKMPWNR